MAVIQQQQRTNDDMTTAAQQAKVLHVTKNTTLQQEVGLIAGVDPGFARGVRTMASTELKPI